MRLTRPEQCLGVLLVLATVAEVYLLQRSGTRERSGGGAFAATLREEDRRTARLLGSLAVMEKEADTTVRDGIRSLEDSVQLQLDEWDLLLEQARRHARAREQEAAAGDPALQLAAARRKVDALPDLLRGKKQQQQELAYAVNTVDKLLYELKNLPALSAPRPNPVFNPPPLVHAPGKKNMVIGISTVNRKKNYLFGTVRTIIERLRPTDRAQVKIVVMNGDIPASKHAEVPLVEEAFSREIEDGLLEIRSNPLAAGHAQLRDPSKLTLRWGDKPDRVQWRSKQVLDVSMLIEHCMQYEEYGYFLMLEDDIEAAAGFPTAIRQWIDTHLSTRTDWTVASFYNPWHVQDLEEVPVFKFFGVIGQVFRMSDLPHLHAYLVKNFDEAPLDWIFVDYLTKHRGKIVAHLPSVFQHLGIVSSLSDKTQPSRAADYDPDPLKRAQ
ncbi:hypothetical protein DIPPA_27893 [Diplonema papillatum]|nr:hypothetical protein DIPPA_27893 [Diplonema papillatum]